MSKKERVARKEMDIISIIIPVYNVEKYLKECLDSVVGQTYKRLEIILVDDGSTDGCPQICDDYALHDSRIRVLHKENGGLSDARNAGISVSTGRLLTVIDSDDYVTRDYIECLYKNMVSNDADISVCQREDITEMGQVLNKPRLVEDDVVVGNFECMKAFFVNPSIDTTAWGKLYKKELFNTVNYPYGKYHEDVYTTYLLIAQCERIAISAEKKYFYRHRADSISTRAFNQKHLDSVDGALQRKAFIEENYPKLVMYGNAGVVYASNQCLLRMIQAKVNKKEYIDYLQLQYRKYERDFLRGKNSWKAKIFSIMAYLSVNLLVRSIRYVESLGRYN